MLSSRKNRTVGEGSNVFAVSPLWFLIILFCTTLSLRAEWRNQMISPGDSSKNKLDINDPRNPHCPCHQYQKLADEEYERIQKKENDKETLSLNRELKVPGKNFGEQRVAVNSFWFFHKKRRFMGKNQKTRSHRATKYKISDKLSRCFHF